MCVCVFSDRRDGGYETSPLIGKYCGSALPPVAISHSNNLWIKFESDILITSTGFSAYWDGTSRGKTRMANKDIFFLLEIVSPIV